MIDTLQQARSFVASWLGLDVDSGHDLRDWLVDRNFPMPDNEEPFIWLIRGLPDGDCYKARRVFAQRVAKLLFQKPDVTENGPDRPRLLYNLLSLCAAITEQREFLGRPLYEMYDRHKKKRTLEGAYKDLPLAGLLRAALTLNQLDRKLRPEWMAMLKGMAHAWLPGNVFDGMQGLTWFPPSADPESWGEPSIADLGVGLAMLARHLEDRPGRRAVLRSQIQRIEDTYPGRDWGYDLLMQAERNAWPIWTAESLPCLWINRGDSVIAWVGEAATLLGGSGKKFLEGRFMKFSVNSSILEKIRPMIQQFETALAANPHMSERELASGIRHFTIYCERMSAAAAPEDGDVDESALRDAKAELI